MKLVLVLILFVLSSCSKTPYSFEKEADRLCACHGGVDAAAYTESVLGGINAYAILCKDGRRVEGSGSLPYLYSDCKKKAS